MWAVIIYLFLSEVGTDDTKRFRMENFLPNNDGVKENKVHLVPKFHRRDWEPGAGEVGLPAVNVASAAPEEWQGNNILPQDTDQFKDLVKNGDPLFDRKKQRKETVKKLDPGGALGGGHLSDEGVELGMVRNDDDRLLRDEGYRQHAFNELVSSRIGFHRNVTDTRHAL